MAPAPEHIQCPAYPSAANRPIGKDRLKHWYSSSLLTVTRLVMRKGFAAIAMIGARRFPAAGTWPRTRAGAAIQPITVPARCRGPGGPRHAAPGSPVASRPERCAGAPAVMPVPPGPYGR